MQEIRRLIEREPFQPFSVRLIVEILPTAGRRTACPFDEKDMAGAGIEPATRGFSVHCSAN
jgi:hypothetical protein